MTSRMGTLTSVFTSSKRETGYDVKPEDFDFYDPKSLKKFKEFLQKSSSTSVGAHSELSSFYHSLKTNPKTGLTHEDLNDPTLYKNRVHQFGLNTIPTKKATPFWKLMLEAMKDKVLIVLSVVAVVSLALGLYEYFGEPDEYDAEGKKMPKVQWVEGVAIIVAVAVVVLVGSVNDYQKEKQFARLNKKKEDKEIIVIRNSQEVIVSIFDLLVGDVVQLQTGDILPADGVLIDGHCECDESSVTGETKNIKKYPVEKCLEIYESFAKEDESVDLHSNSQILDPFLISGAQVLSGYGRFLITSVGLNSMYGKTFAALDVEAEVTPLQYRLNKLTDGISIFGLASGLLLFIVLFIRFLVNIGEGSNGFKDFNSAKKGDKFLNIVITSIAIIVVAVPEGLPLAVTLALAFATTRMAKDSNLVRVLKSCETMGSATTICSDKTGTLTENRMRVVRGLLGGHLEFNNTVQLDLESVSGSETENEKKSLQTTASDVKKDVGEQLANSLLANCVFNSTAFENAEYNELVLKKAPVTSVSAHQSKSNILSRFKLFGNKSKNDFAMREPEPYTGSKTEVALLIFCEIMFDMKDDRDLATLRNKSELLGVSNVVKIIPFESSRKWSGIITLNTNGDYVLYIKGAAEMVAKQCKFISNNKGELEPLTGEAHQRIHDKISNFSSNALRSICLAHYNLGPNFQVPESEDDTIFTDLLASQDSALTIDGLVGIQDPLRAGVSEAIRSCKTTGIDVKMLTGDNLLTGKSIAMNCGIVTEEDLRANPKTTCMEGPEFRKLSNDEIKKILPGLKVLARSSPEDKKLIVQNLKELDEVVAVTGDGTNDAPALKLANVGFSMGISGTDVAREASDIILMTDDFSSIVSAIKWGRCVSSSIRKFVQFQLTVNVTAVVLTFVSAVSSGDGKSVLTAVQLLWVNMIMDTLAALALATDNPNDDILKAPPASPKSSLISVSMWKSIFGQSFVQLIITFVLHYCGKSLFFKGHHEITSHQQTQLDALTFNAFVWLQFFALLVSRKLDECENENNLRARISRYNLNFFEHFFSNWYFIIILAIIGGFQVLIMFVGGAAFSTARQTPGMWATAILCGVVSIPAGLIIRIVPNSWIMKVFPHTFVSKMLSKVFNMFKKKNKKENDAESAQEPEEKINKKSIQEEAQQAQV